MKKIISYKCIPPAPAAQAAVKGDPNPGAANGDAKTPIEPLA